ncbi:MAG TPA: hypothetical protein VN611_07955 [Patescibacteria group bacterium]|nr:hypothetical protein [Patescibacteria group bacterium]
MSGYWRQRGSAVAGVLVAILVLGIIGITLASVSSTEFSTANEFHKGVAAQYLAEAGALRAIVRLRTDAVFAAATTGGTGIELSGTLNDGTSTAGKYSVRVTGTGGERVIVSRGMVGTQKPASRHVVVTVRLTNTAEGVPTLIFTPVYWTNVPP